MTLQKTPSLYCSSKLTPSRPRWCPSYCCDSRSSSSTGSADIAELDGGRIAVVTFPNPNQLTLFNVRVTPDTGLWVGANYLFTVTIGAMYPHDPPRVHCETKVCLCLSDCLCATSHATVRFQIYHPNIGLCECGRQFVCSLTSLGSRFARKRVSEHLARGLEARVGYQCSDLRSYLFILRAEPWRSA
jgi:hypothetical protein